MCEKGFEGRNGKEAGTIDIYEKRAEELMKLGDEILAERKRKSAIKRRAVFAVSGICAVFIVGFGIIHNNELFDSLRKPIPDKSFVNEPVTETTAYTTTASHSDTAVVTTEVNTTNDVTAVKTTQTESIQNTVSESLTAEYSAVTTKGSAGVQNLTITHTENAQNTVANTKPHTVITTDSRTTTTGIVSTATQAVTSTVTTDEEGIPCTISQITQTTTKMSTTTSVASTYELTVNTIHVLTTPTTAQCTVVTMTNTIVTTDIDYFTTKPTTAQVTSVVAVTTIPTVLPGNTQGELNDRFEWQGRIFIKTPYYADKANATDYLGNVGDNQIYSLGYNNAYICFLMLVDDNYIICVNEEYYEYVIEKILGGIV